MRFMRLTGFFLLAIGVHLGSALPAWGDPLTFGRLTCEMLENPLGIDVERPRLSWVLESNRRGAAQSAYQVLAASSREKIDRGEADLWDSGRVKSDQSILIEYAGETLASGQQAFWKVRVWDEAGDPSAWSEAQTWSHGLRPDDWRATWIGVGEENVSQPVLNDLNNASWIWLANDADPMRASVRTGRFRSTFELPRGIKPTSATIAIRGDNQFELNVNGRSIGGHDRHQQIFLYDVTKLMRGGENMLGITLENKGEEQNPAGVVMALRVEFDDREPLIVTTGSAWEGSASRGSPQWKPARVVAPHGGGPWGNGSHEGEDRPLPARYLRKDVTLDRPVDRAIVYLSGLGLSELYIDGKRVGDAVLSPGLTDYDKRVYYVTHDITEQLQQGDHAIGVILGNGRFHAPRLNVPTPTRTFGHPRLLLQLQVEFADGTEQIITSDETWSVTTDGPIRENNEYDGEVYDARMELDGWSEPGYNAAGWSAAQTMPAPVGTMRAEMVEPIRVVEDIKPISMERVGNQWVFDLGQNMVGWVRLQIDGKAGQQITVRHAEEINNDGTLYTDNLRSAKAQTVYTCKGNGVEVYEPRFTYMGFRYVAIEGLTQPPSLSDLTGRVVHDDLRQLGTWESSNPLLNQLWENIRWGLRGNYRSIITDCPQRDERQAWLGDRGAVALGEMFVYDTGPLYDKWFDDIADAQQPDGNLSSVCPAYWPMYVGDVTWPSMFIIAPGSVYEQTGDRRAIADHYEPMKRWLDMHWAQVNDGVTMRDTYGDWCAPPRKPEIIHAQDPALKTHGGILATSYLAHNHKLMAKYAYLLGKAGDAEEFEHRVQTLTDGLNRRFFNTDEDRYDNGSQTSYVLPLAFGLVPDDKVDGVFEGLVHKIETDTDYHIGTGLIGGGWLNRVLTDHGRPDLSYIIANQTDYPSWGYMIQNGATTVWELWNGNTANPAMNSGNHIMLVGDLLQWMHHDLAGIEADFEQPGFKHILMRPTLVGNLRAVNSTHVSPHGLIASDWRVRGEKFNWSVTIPVNTRATLFVPTPDAGRVTVDGKPVSEAEGVEVIGEADGRVKLRLVAGRYELEALMRR